jgi:hypothetical protein
LRVLQEAKARGLIAAVKPTLDAFIAHLQDGDGSGDLPGEDRPQFQPLPQGHIQMACGRSIWGL